MGDNSELLMLWRTFSESSELVTQYLDENQVENLLLDLGSVVRIFTDVNTRGTVVQEKELWM